MGEPRERFGTDIGLGGTLGQGHQCGDVLAVGVLQADSRAIVKTCRRDGGSRGRGAESGEDGGACERPRRRVGVVQTTGGHGFSVAH